MIIVGAPVIGVSADALYAVRKQPAVRSSGCVWPGVMRLDPLGKIKACESSKPLSCVSIRRCGSWSPTIHCTG